MALWGLNDNLASPGTVTMSWTKETGTGFAGTEGNYTITGSGTSFGYVGCGTVGDIIRLGVKGGEGGYGDYFGDSTIVAVASSECISIADTSSLLNVAIAATDYYISELPKYTTQDGMWSEANTAEPSLEIHLKDNAYAAMALPTGLTTGELGSYNIPIFLGGTLPVPAGVDIQQGDAVYIGSSDLPVLGVGTAVVVASEFNTGTNNQTVIGINTGAYVDFIPFGAGGLGASLTNGSANLLITAIGSSTISVGATTNTGIDTGDKLIINTPYAISIGTTLTSAISSGETLIFKRVVAGVDKTVYGIGQTVGAGISAAPGTLAYTTQGGGWVGVTTYMDCQGSLRVKSEILVATSSGNPGSITGVSTGSNGLLFPTNLG